MPKYSIKVTRDKSGRVCGLSRDLLLSCNKTFDSHVLFYELDDTMLSWFNTFCMERERLYVLSNGTLRKELGMFRFMSYYSFMKGLKRGRATRSNSKRS